MYSIHIMSLTYMSGNPWAAVDGTILRQSFFFRETSVCALKAFQLIGQGPPRIIKNDCLNRKSPAC